MDILLSRQQMFPVGLGREEFPQLIVELFYYLLPTKDSKKLEILVLRPVPP